MFKDFFDKIAGSKIFCIIFSILVAFALWLYIGYVENPDTTVDITGIPVEFIGEDDILADRNLMLANNDQTVSLSLTGKRSVVTKLKNTNMTVSIDLTNFKSTGDYLQGYTVNFPEDVDESSVSITKWNPMYVSFTIVQRSSKEVELRGNIVGSIADGYNMDSFACTPDTITVSGPQEIVDRISYAWVGLERENLNKSVNTTSGFALMDENGNQVPTDELTISQSEVNVEVVISMVKEVELTVELIDGGGATAEDAMVTVTPQFIEMSGDPAVMEGLNKIVLGTIDLSKFNATYEQVFTSIPIPDNTKNLTGTKEVTVKVEISGFASKKVNCTNISFINPPDGVSVAMVTQSMEVTIRAPQDIIDSITASNVKVVADLVDMSGTTGRVTVNARVYVDGHTDAGGIGEYPVVVLLS